MPVCLGGEIRKIFFVSCVLGGFLFLTGCATSPYMMDRARDAGDIVTLTGGIGVGTKVQTGPVATGLLYCADYWGWRNGPQEPPSGDQAYGFMDLIILFFGEESFYKDPDPRGKGFGAGYLGLTFVSDKSLLKRHPLFHPYYTQIEMCVALLDSVRVGLNPGEFVDFLLGWVGIDFFDDDIGPPKTGAEEQIHTSLNPNAPFYNPK